MRKLDAFALLALASMALLVLPLAAEEVSAPSPNSIEAIVPGSYSGSVQTGAETSSPIAIRILEGGGGLLDLPDENVYGYPLSSLKAEGAKLSFSVGGESGELRFEGALEPAPETSGGPGVAVGVSRIAGRFSRGEVGGSFSLSPSPLDRSSGDPLAVAARGGELRGSLLLPEGKAPFPLAIIVSGAGPADRDGNNYNVPGRSDSLKALALALKSLGIASYRYDKRGAGEDYLLAGPEEDSRFDDYIEDAEAVFKAFGSDARFSKILLVGHTEGALVAAAAAAKLAAAADKAPEGLVLLCASGKTAIESVNEALANSPEEKKAEAAAIMDALVAGNIYPEPSDYFADFFRPSFQPYLASWFRYDIKKEIGAWKGGLLLVQGNRDFQVTMAEFATLAAARPDVPALVVQTMNHALKDVPADLEENYRSFSDPGFALAPGLAEAIAAFVRGEAYPAGLKRFDGGVLPPEGAPSSP
jgi:pimeloyl-ACP methyl ester carboxylesterase